MATIVSEGRGAYTTRNTFSRTKRGRGRVANDALEGFVVYVGTGGPPDFGAPVAFGAALPVAFAITPPSVGTAVLNVVTRRRNRYGVESQNTHPQYIRINTSGDEVLGELTPPKILNVLPTEGDALTVFGNYPGLKTDVDPADTWRVYVGTTSPVPGVDTPVATAPVRDRQMALPVGPYWEGGVTYYVALTVYRTADGMESTAATYTVTLPAEPAVPYPVPGMCYTEFDTVLLWTDGAPLVGDDGGELVFVFGD